MKTAKRILILDQPLRCSAIVFKLSQSSLATLGSNPSGLIFKREISALVYQLVDGGFESQQAHILSRPILIH